MNVVVKTVLVCFDILTKDCKILMDKYGNLLSLVPETHHSSIEETCRKSIESVLKTDASWMPIKFLFFTKYEDDLNIYYGVLVPEQIVSLDDSTYWEKLDKIINSEDIDEDIQKAIWEAVRRIK